MGIDDVEITNAIVGEIYNKLKYSESGKISYDDHYILFEAGNRYNNDVPQEATIELRHEESDQIRRYNLLFEK